MIRRYSEAIFVAALTIAAPWPVMPGDCLAEATFVADCPQGKLVAADSDTDDFFGRFVAINGAHALSGAFGDDEGGVDAGAAYIFRRDGAQWVQGAKIMADDAQANEYFAYAVSIWGDFALVGAVRGRVGDVGSGSAYVFYRDDNGTPDDPGDDLWNQQAKLTADDAAQGDLFGVYVAIEGHYAVVGSDSDDTPIHDAGSVYVFVRNDQGTPTDPSDDTWSQQAKLVADDAGPDELFGRSVGISGDWIIVGVYADDDAGSISGSAYLFRRVDGGTPADPTDDTWVQQVKILAADAAPGDQFGVTADISGDHAVLGAHRKDGVAVDAGAAFVFRRDDNDTPADLSDDTWIQQAKLTASDATAGDAFGRFVSISGDDILVGAYFDDDGGRDSGSAYYFRRDDGGTPADPSDDAWPEVLKLGASAPEADDWYGYTVSISGGIALIGAHQHDAMGEDSGSAYVVDFRGGFDCNSNGINDACEADCNTNGVLDDCDLAGGTSEDCNTNGSPDECELSGSAPGAEGVDCNTNGMIDECETAAGSAADCNDNELPDECETIEAGIDADGDIDLADFARFQACFTGSGQSTSDVGCCIFDLKPDGDVDLDDFAPLHAAIDGPG